jgi:hypothetical protein
MVNQAPSLVAVYRVVLAIYVLTLALLWSSAASASGQHGTPPPPLPPLTVLGSVETNKNPVGIAINSNRSEALVANRDTKSISLINIVTLTELWEVTIGRGPTGVAINPNTNVGVVTLHDESSVALINLTTRAVLGKVRVSGRPLGVAVDPGYNVAVVAVQNDTVAIIDLATQTRVTEIRIGKRPVAVSVNPLTHVAAITNEHDGSVVLVDYTFVANATVTATITLPHSKLQYRNDSSNGPRAHPTGVAFDYSPSLNRLVVTDPGTRTVVIVTLNSASEPVSIQSLPFPGTVQKPAAVAVNPGKDYAIITTDQNNVFSMTLTNPAFTGSLPYSVDNGPRTPQGVAIDPATCRGAVTNRGLDKGKNRLQGNALILGISCSPVITALDPPSAQAGTTFTLKITGTGLVAGTTVNVGDTILIPSTPAGVGVISASVVAPATPGTVQVSVTAGGVTSNNLPLVVTQLAPPILCSVSPLGVTADGADLDLTLLGRNVGSPATAVFGGQQGGVGVQVVSITAITPATDAAGCTSNQRVQVKVLGYPTTTLTTHASIPDPRVGVVNPDGGPSNTLPVALLNPRPFLSSLQPTTAPTSTEDKVLTIFGGSFVLVRDAQGNLSTLTQVRFNGEPLDTVVPDPAEPTSKLLATVPFSLLTLPQNLNQIVYTVDVANPAPGGGVSLVSQPFTVVAGTLPSGITVTSVSVDPVSAPTAVALFKEPTTLTGVVGIGNELTLRLIDLTNAASPTLLASPIVQVGAPTFDGIGDMVTLPGSQHAVALTLPDTDQLVVVNFSVLDPLTGLPTVTQYPMPGSVPRNLAVDASANKLVVVGLGDFSLHVFNVVQTGTVTLLPAMAPIDLTPALRDVSVLGSSVAVNPATGIAVVLDSPDPPDTGAAILVNYLGTGGVSTTYALGLGVARVAIDQSRNEAVITEPGSDKFRVLNLATGLTRSLLQAGDGPQGVAVDPLTHKAVIVNTANNELTRVDLNPAVPATSSFQIGSQSAQGPVNVVWDPATGTVLSGVLINSGSTSAIVVGGLTPARIP